MDKLIPVNKTEDILPGYRETPIGRLLEYHNLGRKFDIYKSPELLIGTCMDFRINLKIPGKFAFVIRAAGANLRNNDFPVSFAISVGNVRHMAIIGHTDCGMINLPSKRDTFIEGLVNRAGWNEEEAVNHFTQFSPKFEIGNETDFTLSQTKQLRKQYPGIQIAPLIYDVESHMLLLIKE